MTPIYHILDLWGYNNITGKFRNQLWESGEKNLHDKINAVIEKQKSASEKFDEATKPNIPAAPFVTDTNAWTKLGLKVALKEAIRQGVDRIAWTTGEQQNERYDLSKQIDKLDVVNKNGVYNVYAYKGDDVVIDQTVNNESELEGLVGKELAQKAVKDTSGDYEYKVGSIGRFQEYQRELQESYGNADVNSLERYLSSQKTTEESKKYFRLMEDANVEHDAKNIQYKGRKATYSGIDLRVGGKGMIGFYGSPKESKLGIVGNIAKSLFKQEPKAIDLGHPLRPDKIIQEEKNIFTKGTYKILGQDGEAIEQGFDSYDKAYTRFSELMRNRATALQQAQHSIYITPALKAEVQKGLPLFQKEGKTAKGAVETLANGRKIIHALQSPDFSTMVHEIAHVFSVDLTEQERNTVNSWAGTKTWNSKTDEVFARGFERYMRIGKAPNAALQNIFEKAKQWLTAIYRRLKGSSIAKNINPDIKENI